MDLAQSLSMRIKLPMTWIVFGLCLAFTALGIWISYVAFPPTVVKGGPFYVLGIVIAFAVMGAAYGAKYNNTSTRDSFSPLDVIQFTMAGFLWPSTWPALAEKAGQVIIQPAPDASAPASGLLQIFFS